MRTLRGTNKTSNLMENQMLLHATLLSTAGTADTLKLLTYANLNPVMLIYPLDRLITGFAHCDLPAAVANLWAPDPCGSDLKDSSALPLQCSATISFNLAVLVSFQGPRKDTFISQVAPTQKALFYARLTFSPYHPTLCSCPHLPFPSIGCCHRNTVT